MQTPATKLPMLPARPVVTVSMPRQLRNQAGVPKGPDGKRLPPPPGTSKLASSLYRAQGPHSKMWVPSTSIQGQLMEDVKSLLNLPKDAWGAALAKSPFADFHAKRIVASKSPFSNARLTGEAIEMLGREVADAGGPVLSHTANLRSGPINYTKNFLKETLTEYNTVRSAVRKRKLLAMLGLVGLGLGAGKAIGGSVEE